MKFGGFQVELLSDGTFSLDPGAFFGIVPRPIWGKRFRENGNGRIKLSLTIPLLMGEDFSVLIDSGIGMPENEKMRSIFEVDKSADLIAELRKHTEPDRIRFIVQSHLHFDHAGHSMDGIPGAPLFRNASVVAQSSEFAAYYRPNEFTRRNYSANPESMKRVSKIAMKGSGKIGPGIRAIKTGGHTPGHQVIVVGEGSRKLIYFGDLVPSAFHVTLPYITAIDSFPLETIRMKRKLISMAIRDSAICVFNHDLEVPVGTISGDPDKPKVEKIDLD